MKQIITIEIEEEGSEKYDYTILIMQALYERRNAKMTENYTFDTKEDKEKQRKIAIECERLINATAHANIEWR